MRKTDKININIYDEDVYADYGSDDAEFLDEMLVEAVEKNVNSKPISRGLEVNFVVAKGNKIDEDRFVEAYRNTAKNKLDTKTHEIVRCIVTGCVMVMVAVSLLLAFVYFFSKLTLFWVKAGEVAAWVFTWASVEILTIEFIQLLIDRAKIRKILKAKIILTNKTK